MTTLRDTLRSVALKSTPRKKSKFTYEGKEFEVMSPTVGEYVKITEKSKTTIDTSVWAMIYLVVIPDTTETVFEDTDYNIFMGQSLDGFMVAAKDAIIEALSGVESDVKKDTPDLS